MNYLAASKRLINTHGINVIYNTVLDNGYDVETGTNTVLKIQTTVKAYPKQIVANSYNYPDLIGKESIMFYLYVNSFVPKVQDEIVYKGLSYKVMSLQETVANGQVVLYRLLSVRG